MSHMKIATKILEVMGQIQSVNDLHKLNEILIAQKLITKVSYEILDSKERVAVQGVTWQLITVSCKLTIIDFESEEEITYVVLGSGMDCGDKAVIKAQREAFWYAWIAALSIEITELTSDPGPEIIVETPEFKLIEQIKALWKWDPALFEDYFIKRRGKSLSELNIPELTVERDELQVYIRGNSLC